MSGATSNPPEQRRPTASRMNSETLRAMPKSSSSASVDKTKREIIVNNALQANTNSGPATSDLQEPKAKKKPRKIAIRKAQASATLPAPSHDPSDSKLFAVETKEERKANETSLDSRVTTLESEYHKLHRRTNSNTVEIGKLQASTRTAPDRSTGDAPQEKTEPTPDEKGNDQFQVDAVSHSSNKSKDPYPTDLNRVEELSDEEIETIPRSTAPAIGGPPEQNQTVALKGSYKIPLPSTLSTDDVRAVQSGLAAASSVAREIATAMRGSRPRNDSVLNETGQEKRETAPTTTTSITNVDSFVDASSPRSWTSLLNSCTKLVSKAASAIEMEAAVEATRNSSLRSRRAEQQSTNPRPGQRTTDTFNIRANKRQKPATRTYSNNSRPEGLKPTIPLSKPSTPRRSSVTAPTQSSASKNSTRAAGPTFTSQARKRNVQKDPKSMGSQRPGTATRMMST